MRLLLSSVFKPYAVDDPFGRKENVMELFHNQITREQGIFSLRMNHPSSGLHLIAENLETPTMVLDFPSLREFEREAAKGYDVVGLSFIVPNFKKAQHMAQRVRQISPRSKIVLGGHGTQIPNVETLIENDAICRGEGVGFMRELMNERVDAPIRHPAVPSAFNRHFMGTPIGGTSAFLMPGNGCPNACDFCCTTHFFKHKYVPYLKTGRKVYDVLCDLERKMGAKEFFVLDENFLKYRDRAEELLSLMEANNKQWSFGLFSSAESIGQYGLDFLRRMGIFFMWIGVESKRHVYAKNRGVDMRKLVASLRDCGIAILTSGILFLDHHTKENIDEDIDYMVGLESDFVQFMQLGPLPGTQLYKRMEREGRLLHAIPFEEWHGQHQIWFRHDHFTQKESELVIRQAFERDYQVNGPSLLRMLETYIRGYQHFPETSEPFMQGRKAMLRERIELHRPTLPVMEKLCHTRELRARARRTNELLTELFGPMSAADKARAVAVNGFSLAEALRLATVGSVRQPATQWTPYRLSPAPFTTRVRSVVERNLSKPLIYARSAFAPRLALLKG